MCLTAFPHPDVLSACYAYFQLVSYIKFTVEFMLPCKFVAVVIRNFGVT